MIPHPHPENILWFAARPNGDPKREIRKKGHAKWPKHDLQVMFVCRLVGSPFSDPPLDADRPAEAMAEYLKYTKKMGGLHYWDCYYYYYCCCYYYHYYDSSLWIRIINH